MTLSEALNLAERIEREDPLIRIPRLPLDGSISGFSLECEDLRRGIHFVVRNPLDWAERKATLHWDIVPAE